MEWNRTTSLSMCLVTCLATTSLLAQSTRENGNRLRPRIATPRPVTPMSRRLQHRSTPAQDSLPHKWVNPVFNLLDAVSTVTPFRGHAVSPSSDRPGANRPTLAVRSPDIVIEDTDEGDEPADLTVPPLRRTSPDARISEGDAGNDARRLSLGRQPSGQPGFIFADGRGAFLIRDANSRWVVAGQSRPRDTESPEAIPAESTPTVPLNPPRNALRAAQPDIADRAMPVEGDDVRTGNPPLLKQPSIAESSALMRGDLKPRRRQPGPLPRSNALRDSVARSSNDLRGGSSSGPVVVEEKRPPLDRIVRSAAMLSASTDIALPITLNENVRIQVR